MTFPNLPLAHDSFNRAESWYSIGSKGEVTSAYLNSWWVKNVDLVLPALRKLGWHYGLVFPDCVEPVGNRGLLFGAAGALVTERELSEMKCLMQRCNEGSFFVVENAVPALTTNKTAPPIALEFPTTISYDEILCGGSISQRFLDFNVGHYFMFGSSGLWGKFVAYDIESPLEIFVFDHVLMPYVCHWYMALMRVPSGKQDGCVPRSWLTYVDQTGTKLKEICESKSSCTH